MLLISRAYFRLILKMGNKKRLGIGLFLLAFSFFGGLLASGELLITELMYDPSTEMGSDYDLEWIEVYNNGTELVNLSGFTINNKKVYGGLFFPNTYLIIAKKLFSEKNQVNNEPKSSSFEAFYGNNDGTWNALDGNYLAVDAEAFSLGNAKGEVVLSNGLISAKANYSKSMGGDGKGHSLELVDGEWLESKELYGTPGRKNTAENTANLFLEKSSDLRLTVYLDEKLYAHQNYDNLFKIELLEKKNCSIKDEVKVKYSLNDEENKTISEDQFFREEIGCSTYSNTGKLDLETEGTYTLCGEIISASVPDYNVDNNKICQEIKVIDTSKIPCDLSLVIDTIGIFYAYPESIGFDFILSSEEYPYFITYWIEDLFGNKLKEKYTTTNTNKKSFTPNIDEEDRVVFLKAEMETVCNDTNLSNNFTNYHLIVPLSLKSNAKLKTDELTLVVEGLGLSEDKDFELKNIHSSETEVDSTTSTKDGEDTEKTNQKLAYEIIEKPAAINPDEEFAVGLGFNGDEKEHSLSVYGYLYRGSKCYSCCDSCDEVLEREANKLEVQLDAGEEKEIELPFKADEKLEAGEYKLKVKIRVDEQITEKELTETISVKDIIKEKTACLPVYSAGISGNKPSLSSTEKKIATESSGVVVYESSSEKAKDLTAYILIIVLGLVCAVLGWRK